ncbi:Dehydrogenase/reductase SDR family protein 7-like [Diplonema papillatum]|nr:Dehydrogenase/reductase SDR family protein 7-like [Diplonema papillatum]
MDLDQLQAKASEGLVAVKRVVQEHPRLAAAALAAVVLQKLATADADATTLLLTRLRRANVEGKVVWITGASSGIGEELAYAASNSGAYLILSARRQAELERVRAACKTPENVVCLPLDVLDMESHPSKVADALAAAKRVWKAEGIDVLVNNAGVSQRALVEEHLDNLDNDRKIMEVNYFGTVSLTKAVLKASMLPRKSGRVVFVSSVAGKVGAPAAASYSAAKHAVQGWANTLRYEVYDQNITVLCCCPGPVATAIAKNAYGATGEAHGSVQDEDKGKMSAARCAELLLNCISDPGVSETWISPHPVLGFLYATIYAPSLAWLIGIGGIRNRIESYKTGRGVYGMSMFDIVKRLFVK